MKRPEHPNHDRWHVIPDQIPGSMSDFMLRFLEWMAVSNYSPATIKGYAQYLGYFQSYCEDREIKEPRGVTRAVLERFQVHIFHYRGRQDKPLSRRGQAMHLAPVKSFFSWLTRQHHILYNPASEIDPPKVEQRLPKAVLNEDEAETVLNSIDVEHPMGLRDRAVIEVLYSTGLRRQELLRLAPGDIDWDRGTIMVRQAKGHKDRMIPIGDRALAWLKKYIEEVRIAYVIEPDHKPIFLNNCGRPMTLNRLTQMVRMTVDASGIAKRGSCHLFRHTMATAMLEHGADIRYIQEMLGHSKLETTQIYTQVSIRKLKEVHTQTHPARMTRTES